MSKFLVFHTADVHVGVTTYGVENPATGMNTRTEDCLQAIDSMIDAAIEKDAKAIIWAGDLFKTKNPTLNELNAFSSRVKRSADAGIFNYLLAGNHDSSAYVHRKNTLDHFKTLDVDNVFVTRGGENVDLGWIQFSSVPYWTSPEDIVERVNENAKSIDFSRPAVLVVHAQLEFADFPGAHRVNLPFVPLSALTSHPWTYVAVGHIHKNQKLADNPPVWYSGSLVRNDFNEEHDPKGYMSFMVDGNKAKDIKFNLVKCLRMLTIRGSMEEIKTALAKPMPDLQGLIIRCIIKDEEEAIDHKFIKEKLGGAFKLSVEVAPKTRNAKKIDVGNLTNMDQYVERYFDGDDDKVEIIKIIDELRTVSA